MKREKRKEGKKRKKRRQYKVDVYKNCQILRLCN